MAAAILAATALVLAALNVAAAAYILGLSARRRAAAAVSLPHNPAAAGAALPSELSTYGTGSGKGSRPPALPGRWNGPLRLAASAASRGNPNSEQNGDAWICDDEAGLYAVLDGIGESGAESASRKAAVSIDRWIDQTRSKEGLEPGGSGDAEIEGHRLGLALDHAHAEVMALRRELTGKSTADFGCSVAAALRAGSMLVAGWLGDTRIYRQRDGLLRLLTRDHSEAGMQERAGVIDEEEARRSPLSTSLIGYLGAEGLNEPDTLTREMQPGDRFLLCSGGVGRALGNKRLRDLLDRNELPEEITERIVTEAANANPDDDMTAVLIEVAESMEELEALAAEVEFDAGY